MPTAVPKGRPRDVVAVVEAGLRAGVPAHELLDEEIATAWAEATGVPALVFGFAQRALIGTSEACLCRACPVAEEGRCDPAIAHQFGCYEAESRGGQRVYYCPAGLGFVATLVFEGEFPACGLVSGPVGMGDVEDVMGGLDPALQDRLETLPHRSSGQVDALLRVQQTLCDTLSTPTGERGREPAELAWQPLPDQAEPASPYPDDLVQRLTRMVRRGDRAGAVALINEALGQLDATTQGDFGALRRGAVDLVTLLWDAAVAGGADADAIFGDDLALGRRLAAVTTKAGLSGLLASAVHRFAGYAFAFAPYERVNLIRHVVAYVREHYAGPISLAEAAEELRQSPEYLSTVCFGAFGLSFTGYVQRFRLDRAKRLLLDTRRTPGEVAALSGFGDEAQLARALARDTGQTPAQFRGQEPAAGDGGGGDGASARRPESVRRAVPPSARVPGRSVLDP
jgi:AraC-like DNA-binding protein